MPAPLSPDLRRRILFAYQRGEGSMVALPNRFAVSRATVERLVARHKDGSRPDGIAPPRTLPTGPPPLVPDRHHGLFATWLSENPSLTQHHLADRYAEATGQVISRRTAGRTISRMGYSYKKSRSEPRRRTPKRYSTSGASSPTHSRRS